MPPSQCTCLVPPSSQSCRHGCVFLLLLLAHPGLTLRDETSLHFILLKQSEQSMRTCRAPTPTSIHGAASRPHAPHSLVDPTFLLWRPLTYAPVSLVLGHQFTDTVDFLLWLHPFSSSITSAISNHYLHRPNTSQWKWEAHRSSSVFYWVL